MSEQLPSLRLGLDAFPSPLAEQPGLLLRDPYRFTEAVIVVPPLLAYGLSFYDGEHTVEDLRGHLAEAIGQAIPDDLIAQMTSALSSGGFLEDEAFEVMRRAKVEAWEANPDRVAMHAGSGYSDQPATLAARIDEMLSEGKPESRVKAARSKLILPDFDDPMLIDPGASIDAPIPEHFLGIAAPHVSPEGGVKSYGAAYARLRAAINADPKASERVYVLLGTSHYGEPDRFGLTRKSYLTPMGPMPTDAALVDFLARGGGDAVVMEDYCHAIEHSIEFQAVFLRHVLGSEARILPILCGSFGRSLVARRPPEEEESVRRFLGALGDLAAREGDRLRWILGVDLAHIGARYGDGYAVEAHEGPMEWIEERDRERLSRIAEGDARGFFELAMPEGDDLRWCGLSPLYTFLTVRPEARGSLLRYDQWNIDAQSVVSFCAMELAAAR
ncbi:MAG: AmmeMemoRadiSam system protein B [Candidatus Eisenbacteria bacterium]